MSGVNRLESDHPVKSGPGKIEVQIQTEKGAQTFFLLKEGFLGAPPHTSLVVAVPPSPR